MHAGLEDNAVAGLAPRIETLRDVWALMQVESGLALKAWAAAPSPDKGDAYGVYRAALDREEEAARRLASEVNVAVPNGRVRLFWSMALLAAASGAAKAVVGLVA